MCHEYGIRWWKPESTVNKKAEDVKAGVTAPFPAAKDEKSNAVAESKVDKKELVPAE